MSQEKTLELFFDFASPYGFFATVMAEELAQDIGRELVWKPYLMGAAMKVTNIPTLVEVPMKKDYIWIDLKRYCKQYGVRLSMPEGFPFMSVAACRAHYALLADDPALAGEWCKAVARAAWVGGKNMSDMAELAAVATELGIDPSDLAEKIQQPEIKERLKVETDSAIERGIWGSPHFVVDGTDPYWGCDKRYEIRATYEA